MFKSIAWNLLKPVIRKWLQERALVLPAAKRAEAARRFKVGEDVIVGVNGYMIDEALSELDKFRP